MTILVTGGKGAFGKALTPLLREKYKETVIATGRDIAKNDDYVTCDVTDSNAVYSIIQRYKPRLIFHLAGSFTGDFESDFKVNTLSAKHIFDGVLSAKTETRVVLIGSAAEYGAVNPEDNPIPELYPCNPVSVYGLTKHFQTEISKFYARTTKIDLVIARVFNLAIPGLSSRLFWGKVESLIHAYKNKMVSNMEFGNLSSQRDYIGLDDASTQLFAVADCGTTGEIYNIGSGFPRTMRSILLDELCKNGISANVVKETTSDQIGRKEFDVPIIYAQNEKILRLIKVKSDVLGEI